MKKLLLATSILGMTAGIAAADITLSGDARMGLLDDFGTTDVVFSSRARVKFTMSGESDTGFTFGAEFRANDAVAAASGTAGSVFISGAFGKLSMGDVDGAAAAAMGQVDGVGMTGLSDLNELSFLGNGGADQRLFDAAVPTVDPISGDESVLYEYTSGAFAVYASANQREYTFNGFSNDNSYAVAASYTMDGYKVALGYETIDVSNATTQWDLNQLSIGADATLGPVVMKARYAKGDVEGTNGYTQDIQQWAVSGTYTVDALAVTAYVSSQEFDRIGFATVERDAYGLGASYDLGGGAKVVGGYAKNKTADTSAMDIGLSFSF